MNRIEAGMLVRIIHHDNISPNGQKYIGGVFEVVQEYGSNLPYFKLSGATDPGDMWWADIVLEPINPDSTPADEDFKADLNRWMHRKVPTNV